MHKETNEQASSGGKGRLVILGLVIITALVLAKVFGIGDRIGELRGWIESLGAWGPLVFIVLYIVAVVFMMPASALTIGAGALFGSVLGIGGGPIGCELAQAFSRLGSDVTIVEVGSQFLSREDPDAAAILAHSLEQDGINILLNTSVQHVVKMGQEKLVTLTNNGVTETLMVDEVLVGVGRAPNVEGLNLEGVGVKFDKRKGVAVNDYLQTTNPRIYAAGDICSQYKFTHTADAAARIVIQNTLFKGRKKSSALTIPWCTYTEPEIAHVGLYEQQAKEQGIALDTYQISMSSVDRSIADGEEEGFVKIHVKKGTDQILGATIVARHAGEMISEITLAMVGKIGLGTIASVIHPYPTQAEAIKKAADAYNRTRLTPFVKRLFERWLAWTR